MPESPAGFSNGLDRELQALRAYRAAFDHHAIVAVTDRSGRITRVNDLFCQISKYSREELIGQNHRILNSGFHPKRFWVEAWRTIAHGQVWHGEVCNRAKDGTLYWVDTTIVPIADNSGRIVEHVAIRADITSRKHAEEALRAAKNAADAANNAKSEFLANMSHEIRTPMTSILGYADLLGDAIGDPARQAEYIDIIRRNGDHLLAIINDVLDIAKIEAGKLVIENIGASPIRVLEEVCAVKQIRMINRPLTMVTRQLTPIPTQVHTDPTRLKQILMNLIGNAIKFTERGQITVSIAYDCTGERTGELRIDVADTGVGMSPSQLQRLFGAFEQADASTTRRFGGTGLGLRISRRLAEMLGGTIEVESVLGRGSAFRLRIRADRPVGTHMIDTNADALVSAQRKLDKSASVATAAQDLEGMRILLAEDGVDNQRLISHLLCKAGAEVEIANNGREAIEMLSQGGVFGAPLLETPPFDLLLTDMQMPELDGYAAARLLRARGSRLRIVALTAHAMDGDGQKCLDAGCDAFATKPIDRGGLLSLCGAGRRKSRQQPGLPSGMPLQSEFADDDVYAPLIEAFVRDLPTRLKLIKRASMDLDFPKLVTLLHQMKGAGGSYGFPSITAAAAKAEAIAREGEDREALHDALFDLEQLCDRARLMAVNVPSSDATALARAEKPGNNALGTDSKAQQNDAQKLKVLVVDDAPEIHELLNEELSRLGTKPLRALHGAAAIETLRSTSVDLILLDLDLPDIHGMDLLQTLRLLPGAAQIPVIILTSTSDSESLERAFVMGAVDYVRKPFRLPEMRARVRNALRAQMLLQDLHKQAHVDALTGLLNREALFNRLDEAMHRRDGDSAAQGAVLYLDCDRLKRVNDVYGHCAGDEMLRRIAARLVQTCAEESAKCADNARMCVGRLGGDEFVVIAEGLASIDQSRQLAASLLKAMEKGFEISGQMMHSALSIGIAPFTAPANESSTALLSNADAAMYEAKRQGGGRLLVFDESMRQRLVNRVTRERDLRVALERDQLDVEFQPILCLRTGSVIGMEALARWDHPQLGRLAPADFIPVAVDSGLINPLGEWVLTRACQELAQLRRRLPDDAPDFVCVNVSRRQLGDPELPAIVSAALRASGLEAQRLHLEITESELVQNLRGAQDVVLALKRLGVMIAIDDFGTGYSSLASLHEFPIDVIKLDRSFVARDGDTTRNEQLHVIASAILKLATSLGVHVIAEGVETPDQLALLQELNCELGQGYLFTRPIAAAALPDFCAEARSGSALRCAASA